MTAVGVPIFGALANWERLFVTGNKSARLSEVWQITKINAFVAHHTVQNYREFNGTRL